jgi:serine O-acetyltransferase
MTDTQTLRHVLHCIWCDSARKRKQMGRPLTRLSILRGFFSINVVAVAIFRFSIYFCANGWRTPAMLCYYLNIMLFGFDGSPYSEVGPGLVVVHLNGNVFHAKVGRNATLFGRNGIGGKGRGDTGGWRGGPVIGDHVTLGFGACILTDGDIGDHATVGAGSWCFKSVTARAIVAGMPARLVRMKTAEEVALEAAG